MLQEPIVLGGREFVVARPADPEALLDERRFEEEDEFLPYWAEPWPSGSALARCVAALDLAGERVLELGCGIGLPSLVAASRGANVLATDWAPEAVELVRENAAANGLHLEAAVLDWRHPPPVLGRFELVLAADVLYEERNVSPLVDLLESVVAPAGRALVADPGRRHAAAFFAALAGRGWASERVAAAEIPSGAVTVLARASGSADSQAVDDLLQD